MVKPWADIPYPLHKTLNPKYPKKGSRSRNLRFTLCSTFDQPVEVPKMVKCDQGSPKLGQGPTGPQHSPVTRPESL
jgi:hypothetical protein